MDYYEYPEYSRYRGYPVKRSIGAGGFLVIFVVITILILALLFFVGPYILKWIAQRRIDKVTTDYRIPVLTAIDYMTYKDCNPPPGANISFFYYNFQIMSWDAITQSGVIKIATFVDLGMQEGNVVFTGNFIVDRVNPRTITITNPKYSQIVGTILSRMDYGPWTLTLTSGTGDMNDTTNVLSLSGRDYASAPIYLTKNCL